MWREDGLWSEEYDYYGERIAKGPRGREIREKVEISDKSNVHSLLRKIEFEYIPAVKSTEYFNDLRGRIYWIISDVAAKAFYKSSSNFEKAIGEHVNSLTADIGESLGMETRLALPHDLYHIFEHLDFLSGDKSVSLNNRGDGIKARHIPLILKFMAQKKSELLKRGGAPISTIWAYEEPENNLELASAIELADEMYDIAKSGTAQVILTTHSPAFYDLALRKDIVSLHYVKRVSDANGTIIHKDTSNLDQDLGTLALLRTRIPDLIDKVRADEAARHATAELVSKNCATIFVEGESDRIILDRCVSLFFPEAAASVHFETKQSGGGDNYVIDMLQAWRSHHKHYKEKPLAAGILDGDAEDKKKGFNQQTGVTESAKCFCYTKPQKIIPAYKKGFKVPVTLELLYPLPIWQEALAKDQLKKRKLCGIISESLQEKFFQGTATLNEHSKAPWLIFAEYDFDSTAKIPTAKYLSNLPDNKAHENLSEFKLLISNVLKYLKRIE